MLLIRVVGPNLELILVLQKMLLADAERQTNANSCRTDPYSSSAKTAAILNPGRHVL
jgi:hypothetical protein